MKTAKLVLGILCMVLFLIVTLQSCAVGVANTLTDNEEASGSAGFLVAIMLLAGGIVSVAARKHKGGAIACMVLFLLGALIGFTNAGSYGDLYVWSGLCVIMAIVHFISIFVQNYSPAPQQTIPQPTYQYPPTQQPPQ